MENRTAKHGIIRLTVFLLCAFMTLYILVSCDENDVGGGGEYKDPTQSDNGSDNAEEGVPSENGTNEDGAEVEGESDTDTESDFLNGLPTVEFPAIPFD